MIDDMPPVYAAMDVFCLPSYREGIGYVLLEAAAMQLPVVATEISGCVDAVVDGRTGTLVPLHDANALAQAIGRYLRDPQLRRQHGRAGREQVLQDFGLQAVWQAARGEYVRLLSEINLPINRKAIEMDSPTSDRNAA